MNDSFNLELIGLLYLLKNRRKRNKAKKRLYVRTVNRTRQVTGKYANLIKRFWLFDPERHFEAFRMSVEQFDELLAMMEPDLTKLNRHKLPISAAERLYMTIDFLSTGSQQQVLAHTYEQG